MSVTPICIGHNELISITNNNTSISGSTCPTPSVNDVLAVPTIHPKTIAKSNILAGTTSVTNVNVTPMIRDLSTLCSDTQNPWASLRRHHHPRKFSQSLHRNHHPSIYPSNIFVH